MSEVDINESPYAASPVVPELLDESYRFNFRCHKDIDCFNACCKNIDITLTPYDIIRLKQRLGLQSHEFLREYTVPFEFEKDGMAGVKFKPVDGGTACRFMTEEGCSVYEDRPTSCRYYPVGLVALRKQDEYTDTRSFALVKEPHCHGHFEDNEMSIAEYREDQGVEEFDQAARGWHQLILKKKSSGPAIGKLSLRSRQLFFMANYDMDRFREFVRSEGFRTSFILDEEEYNTLLEDDYALMQFGFRFLRQVLFGEVSIDTTEAAKAAHSEKANAEYEALKAERDVKTYDPASEPIDIA